MANGPVYSGHALDRHKCGHPFSSEVLLSEFSSFYELRSRTLKERIRAARPITPPGSMKTGIEDLSALRNNWGTAEEVFGDPVDMVGIEKGTMRFTISYMREFVIQALEEHG